MVPPIHRPSPAGRALLVTLGILLASGRLLPLGAQTLAALTPTPEAASTLFLRSVRAIRWRAAAQFLHPATLERFHTVVTLMVEADSTGAVRRYLTDTDARGYAALGPEEVFDRAIGVMIDDMPGLMHALYDRDDEVLGHVSEAGDTAHVVYRTTARLSGAVSEVKVMQLTRAGAGWRVVWSDELEVLDAALRGVARSRRPPPPPPTPSHRPAGGPG